jgi:hypothetical protein
MNNDRAEEPSSNKNGARNESKKPTEPLEANAHKEQEAKLQVKKNLEPAANPVLKNENGVLSIGHYIMGKLTINNPYLINNLKF